jgi:CheY-like chemotaxis protein
MRILYLEDFELDVKLMRQYMDSTAHQFASVNTITAARDYFKKLQVDVFLVDVVIGNDTAYDLIKYVYQNQLAKYIIAVTARVLPSERQHCLDLGCAAIISKPFTIDEVENVLGQLVI